MIKPTFKGKHLISDTPELIKRLEMLKSHYVKNGVLTGIGAHPSSKAGATVAAIAAWNEYGTPRIPSRPFMRNAYGVFKSDVKFIVDAMKAVVFCKDGERLRKNPNVKQFFDVCGLKIQSLMIAQIDQGVPPANAASTIVRKGSGHTLFDTGILKKSLAFETVKN